MFDEARLQNDIAILKLDEAVELNENVQVACLPDPRITVYPPSNVELDAVVVGWGRLQEGGDLPDELQNVKIKIYNNSMCENVSVEAEKNWNSQICAGTYDGSADSCQGLSKLYIF
jgi:hypothetical protein